MSHPAHRRDATEMDMDEYQELAGSTAVYPRVYTEQQVAAMLRQYFYEVGDNYFAEAIDRDVARLLDEHETEFSRLVYPMLGLLGEAGELSNKLKKVARDQNGSWEPDQTQDYEAELGDVQWYVAAVARGLGVKLGKVANQNLDKLFDRKARGVLGGSGDHR